MGWQPIETAPPAGIDHLRGLWVYSHSTGEPIYWEARYGHVDDDGDFVDADGDAPWYAADYTHWHPISEPPEAAP